MTTLLDVLALCHRPFCSQAYHEEDAQAVIDNLAPEHREALEVGLLLAEVERVKPEGWSWSGPSRSYDGWYAYLWGPQPSKKCECCGQFDHKERPRFKGNGPTVHAALTALLAQLPETQP